MSTIEALLARLRDCAATAPQGRPTALRLRLDAEVFTPDWLAPLRSEPDDDVFSWRHPEARRTMLALGCYRAVEPGGAERFRDGAQGVQEILDGLARAGDPGPAVVGPLAVGGFAFDDAAGGSEAWKGFPSARLVVPELLLVREAIDSDALWLTVCGADPRAALRAAETRLPELFAPAAMDELDEDETLLQGAWSEPDHGAEYRVRADRSHLRYRAQVADARRAIAEGDLQKVVLARSLRVEYESRFDVATLLAKLENIYPRCVTFSIGRAGARFLGATPELLVASRDTRLAAAAVAGSAPRGRTPEEDAELGRALRESKKEQEEHAIVVRAVVDALEGACHSLSLPESPQLLRIEGIQHLETPIEGTLREPTSVLELGGRMHPTPAVCGAPREIAQRWIDAREGMDRGWYAGAIGFVDAEGGGELRVALRSGVIRSEVEGDRAWLFAGGGLVADSDPLRELEETRVKLRAMLAPLTEI